MNYIMKTALKLRVFTYLDKNKKKLWEIHVIPSNTLLDLHNFFKSFFKLPGNELASFYTANQNWTPIQEITLIDMAGKEKDITIPTMADISLSVLMQNKNVMKLIYVYDFLRYYRFFVEILGEIPFDKTQIYPFAKTKSVLKKSQLNQISKYALSQLKQSFSKKKSEKESEGLLDESLSFSEDIMNEPFIDLDTENLEDEGDEEI